MRSFRNSQGNSWPFRLFRRGMRMPNPLPRLVGELLQEIMEAVKDKAFCFHHDDTVNQ